MNTNFGVGSLTQPNGGSASAWQHADVSSTKGKAAVGIGAQIGMRLEFVGSTISAERQRFAW